MENIRRGTVTGFDESSKFSLEHIECELSVGHPNGDVQRQLCECVWSQTDLSWRLKPEHRQVNAGEQRRKLNEND